MPCKGSPTFAVRRREAAKAVTAAYSSRSTVLVPPAGQCPGWSTMAATHAAAARWEAFTGQLADSIAGLSCGFSAAADAHQATDEASATTLSRLRGRVE